MSEHIILESEWMSIRDQCMVSPRPYARVRAGPREKVERPVDLGIPALHQVTDARIQS
jgi:hypothetical protein